jgi:hypothetical protein
MGITFVTLTKKGHSIASVANYLVYSLRKVTLDPRVTRILRFADLRICVQLRVRVVYDT